MITAQDILDLLPIVADRGWRERRDGFIRDKDGRCPVCALVHEVTHGKVDFTFMAELSYKSAFGYAGLAAQFEIANAADYVTHPSRPVLMAALGMTT